MTCFSNKKKDIFKSIPIGNHIYIKALKMFSNEFFSITSNLTKIDVISKSNEYVLSNSTLLIKKDIISKFS